MKTIFYILLFIYLILNTFVFRYQRTTLGISRKISGIGNSNIQAMLTPAWMGGLGLIKTILIVGLIIWAYFLYNWIFSAAIIVFVFLGTTIVDIVSPFPTYNQCFKIIKKSLTNDMLICTDNIRNVELLKLLVEVKKIEEDNLSN